MKLCVLRDLRGEISRRTSSMSGCPGTPDVSGGLMPQKSTYFYRKLATGMTINPLE